MIVATVVLCPDLAGPPSYDRVSLGRDLGRAGLPASVVDVPAAEPGDDARTLRAHWIGQVAVALTVSGARPPVLLVLPGAAGALAPALGFSQRAARRAVAGYVLVDAECPAGEAVVGDWPDAPVVYVASPAASAAALAHARLRGWQRVDVPDLGPSSLAGAILALVSPG